MQLNKPTQAMIDNANREKAMADSLERAQKKSGMPVKAFLNYLQKTRKDSISNWVNDPIEAETSFDVLMSDGLVCSCFYFYVNNRWLCVIRSK